MSVTPTRLLLRRRAVGIMEGDILEVMDKMSAEDRARASRTLEEFELKACSSSPEAAHVSWVRKALTLEGSCTSQATTTAAPHARRRWQR